MSHHPSQPDPTGGFTLLEALIAMVLVAITATTLIMIQNRTWQRTKTSSRMIEAGNRTEQHIEKLRMTIAENPSTNFPPGDTAIIDKKFTLKRSVTAAYSPADSSIIDNVRKLTVSVFWDQGPNDTLTVTTFVSRDF
jgi:Tfp pilus assembly protein PilV